MKIRVVGEARVSGWSGGSGEWPEIVNELGDDELERLAVARYGIIPRDFYEKTTLISAVVAEAHDAIMEKLMEEHIAKLEESLASESDRFAREEIETEILILRKMLEYGVVFTEFYAGRTAFLCLKCGGTKVKYTEIVYGTYDTISGAFEEGDSDGADFGDECAHCDTDNYAISFDAKYMKTERDENDRIVSKRGDISGFIDWFDEFREEHDDLDYESIGETLGKIWYDCVKTMRTKYSRIESRTVR